MPFKFRGAMLDLPLVRVHLDFPVYRAGNHRTKTLQEEYLAKHPDLPPFFFRTDTDSATVQNAQREILETLVNQQDLLGSFKKAGASQEEPLLCTRDGVVVNGNRRLCAWRKLYDEDPIQYKQFESVELLLLPSDCSEDDVDEIERELQIKKSHRADYSWHTKAAMIKEVFDAGSRNKAQIAELFDMKTSEVDQSIACFDYAKSYLAAIGHQGEWSLVDKEEFAFRKIVAGERTIRDEGHKDVFSACAAALLQTSADQIGDRKYNLIPQLADNISTITEVLEKELLSEGTTASSPRVLAMRTANVCRRTENVKKTVELVRNVLDAVRIKEDDRQRGCSLLSDLTDIATRLVSAKTRDLDECQTELPAALRQVESILENIAFIKSWIETHVAQS
ncbi:MAG: hypothetical protein J6Y19_10875 [Kiritimatiellae bacterium]|nr:hypothetical protein [Kiritimatiellia bacterium]